MNKKGLLGAVIVLIVASVPLFTSWIPLSIPVLAPTRTYSNQALLHETGVRRGNAWQAYYRQHRPGNLVLGLTNGGDPLPDGVFRYDFYFSVLPGHFTGLLSGANDAVRIEAIDATSGEILAARTFQMTDFKRANRQWSVKHVTFSTRERAGHRIEPRVYWQGLTGLSLRRIDVISLGNVSTAALQKMALDFEAMMPRNFIDRGYVVTRDGDGHAEDLGDSAIWTGLYAAAEAWRYQATQEPEAYQRMEKSLWALHALVQAAPMTGTMARYVDADGRSLDVPASKDTYTGFFYGVARSWPYIRNPALKKALAADTASLANHLLNHDLAFVSPDGHAEDFNPYFDAAFVRQGMQALAQNRALRQSIMKVLRVARWYFWIHGQRPPPSWARIIDDLQHPSSGAFEKELLPFLNDLRSALKQVQRNVHRSALRGARQGLDDTPYMKLDLLLLKALGNLDEETGGKPLSKIENLKVLPSESLHALHFLKVAGEILPQPNRFELYYRSNLYEGKALLKTAIQWHQIDEDAISAVIGETEANTRRTASSHLSYLALHDLILLEKDPLIRFQYQRLFEQQFEPMRSDGNAMVDAMQAAAGLSSKQLGLALWSLGQYPVDRRGKGERYWQANRKTLIAAFGGEVNGQARDPLPADLRPRDAFLWQRSAHSIRGDHEGWLYPPLDYLFAYWLARIASPPEHATDK